MNKIKTMIIITVILVLFGSAVAIYVESSKTTTVANEHIHGEDCLH